MTATHIHARYNLRLAFEGNVCFDEDATSCGRSSGGILDPWSTSAISDRCDHASVAFNGYLYLVGGFGDDPSPSLVWYCEVTTYDANCPAEGPF